MAQTAAQESRSTPRPAPRPAPGAAPARPQGAPAGMPAYLRPSEGGEAVNVAPREVELKGVANLDQALGEDNQRWIDAQKRQRGDVRLRFGKLARGTATVHKSDSHYRIDHAAIPLQHALFQRIADSGVAPQLVLKTDSRGGISGFIGLGGAKSASQLAARLRKAPEIIGLAGFTLPSLTLSNHLADGQLRLGVKEAGFRLGGAFHGSFNLDVVDENVTFSASANIRVKGLEQGELRLTRKPDGKISGEASVALALPKNITGGVTVKWDGADISGRGRVGYQGGKFSGEVTIEVLSKEAAKQREQGAKEAEKPAGTAATEKQGKRDLVVFGEGDLQFSFTDWLTGTAHVIIDAKGHLTVIGEITPQKEVELFPQKDYSKDLFKVEARASYGIPVVGNIFIFANIGMDAFAKLGPAKLYKISISGTYSTDPKKKQDFRIQGSLNISAAAGLRLRGEAGAGLEVLDHDIKAGAGINGLAGIRGYAEATPVIGYREKPANEAEDKQGEFFIRGDLEIAAQPFLGLSGDLFVEIDAPWWSPVPDKRWTWPLGGKEWPMGGSFGINAGVDYVFGSQQWPSIEFRKVDFSADKFLTDLYNDKAASKSAKGEQPGKWKEKNTPKSEPPAKAEKKGDAQPGKPPAKGKARPKVQPGTAKRSGTPADPNAKTADGKTVRDYQEAAKKKTGEMAEPVGKGKALGKQGTSKKAAGDKQEYKEKWARGVRVVDQALAYANKTGIGEKELNRILASIRKRKNIGFKKLYAKGGNKGSWLIYGEMSPAEVVTEIKQGEPDLPESNIQYGPLKNGFGTLMKADLLTRRGKKGSSPSVGGGYWEQLVKRRRGGSSYYVRGHLLNDNVHGPGNTWKNLSPITRNANSQHERDVEKPVKEAVNDGAVLNYEVQVVYGRELNRELLLRIEKDASASQEVKNARKEIVEAERYLPTGFVCSVKTRKPSSSGKKVDISPKEIPVMPEKSAPDDYEVEGNARVTYQLEHINLKQPAPVGTRSGKNFEALALEAYRRLPGISDKRARILYDNLHKLRAMEKLSDVGELLASSNMKKSDLEKWKGLASLEGETRWNPPRKPSG